MPPNSDAVRQPLSFPNWTDVLAGSQLPEHVIASHRWQIIRFLRFCKEARSPATVVLAQSFIEGTGDDHRDAARQALRWFFRTGRIQAADGGPPVRMIERVPLSDTPALARDDLGGAGWERDLIVALRQKGLLWRTESTSRRGMPPSVQCVCELVPISTTLVIVIAGMT